MYIYTLYTYNIDFGKLLAFCKLLVLGAFYSSIKFKMNHNQRSFHLPNVRTMCMNKDVFQLCASIKIIKICSESLTAPLRVIFKQSLKEGRFLKIWKKVNVVTVHNKEDKSL